MITNTDVTVYNREYDSESKTDKWTRAYVPDAWWFKSEQSSITAEGRKNQDVITIRIPDISVSVKKDDYIVKGMCDIAPQTVKDLDGLEKVRVTSANYNTFGGNPHIKVVGV
ncbi:hypothetical protein NKF89_04995 [Agathobacter rectalis]|uniref:DUF6751 family protein n=1 Tax=Agathobacter rectalis TaxID=39491 RepID=UPI00220907C8|nr:DUF6751 family protein [Agathobacter rectalis]UTB43644.1 hypothetical protein NKF89_04995 [Agathobacter rectalis]